MNLILDGELIYLRSLEQGDFEAFHRWYCDDEVTRFLGMKPLAEDAAKAQFNQLLDDPNGVYLGIIKKEAERIIGYVFLAHISKSHRVAQEFGIVIGDKDQWGHGYGSEATKLLLEYGFNQLKLHRIQLMVLDFNERALHVYKKLGFVKEGVQREARIVDGEWHNVILMGLLEREFIK